jgi:hypothetical protein
VHHARSMTYGPCSARLGDREIEQVGTWPVNGPRQDPQMRPRMPNRPALERHLGATACA